MTKKELRTRPNTAPDETGIDPDLEFQAGLLAGKVLRKVMTLADATAELDHWQDENASTPSSWRRVAARSLIVTHMMNALLKRGY